MLGGAYYAARQVRPFYKQALQIEPEVLERGSRELESRATALYSDARQHGQWQALFTAEQINGWLATQLAQNQDGELPKNFRDPRVAIAHDVLTLGLPHDVRRRRNGYLRRCLGVSHRRRRGGGSTDVGAGRRAAAARDATGR